MARTGLHYILPIPDLSCPPVSGSDSSAGYVSEEELVSTLSAYIKSDDVSEVESRGLLLDFKSIHERVSVLTGMSDYHLTRIDLDTENLGLQIGN